MKCCVFILFFLSVLTTYAQPGCMDPQAINYNANATINDGSCIYNATNYTLQVKDTFTNTLAEISGMQYWNGKLYAHNDSGNPAVIYETDTTNGIITKEIFLQGIANIDWEDITQDNTHFYIGDIGNNNGDRTDLQIHKFPKSAIGPAYYDTISAIEIETIFFSYPDQLSFTPNANNTPFDCEAMACRNNKLHLFTKNWTLGPSVHYTLPTTAGSYVATRLDSLNTDGVLITAADFAANEQLMLLGYKNSGTAACAFWYIYDFGSGDSIFVKGNKRKIDLGDALTLGQVEGVCFAENGHGFACNERFNPIAVIDVTPKLYRFFTSGWFPYLLNTEISYIQMDSLLFSTKVLNNSIEISFLLQHDDQVSITLFTGKGKKVHEKNYSLGSGSHRLQLENVVLSDGIYYVLFQNNKGEKKISKIFFQNR